MTAVFKKLNLKDEIEIVVIDAPASFEAELGELFNVSVVRKLTKAGDIEFSLSFVTEQEKLDAVASKIVAKAKGDATIWFAYPKKSSKRYKCELDRDRGWDVLGAAGFERVRQVAIATIFRQIRHNIPNYYKRDI